MPKMLPPKMYRVILIIWIESPHADYFVIIFKTTSETGHGPSIHDAVIRWGVSILLKRVGKHGNVFHSGSNYFKDLVSCLFSLLMKTFYVKHVLSGKPPYQYRAYSLIAISDYIQGL